MSERIKTAIKATFENGRRLIEDAEMLEFSEPPATAIFLIRIAQEEFAKAFLLLLVQRGVIPWNQHILRATKDHICKQLIGEVMDWINPNTDWFLKRLEDENLRHEIIEITPKIADAINILRHEKIGRWVSKNWFWVDEPEYDLIAKAIGDGEEDVKKQDALYVRLARDGGLANSPLVGRQYNLNEEKDRGDRLCRLINGLISENTSSDVNYDKIMSIFKIIFSEPYIIVKGA